MKSFRLRLWNVWAKVMRRIVYRPQARVTGYRSFHRWFLVPSLLLAANVTAQEAPQLPFATALVTREEAPLERWYDGTVEAVNQATMSAQTTGRVAEVFYDVDDYVEAGSPIIRFTNTEQQAGLRQAQAAVKEAVARQKEANEEFRRVSALYEAGSASKRQFDSAFTARDAAAARVAAAQSAIKASEQQVEYTLVRAPYAGVVTERHVEVGESVTIGQPLMSGLSLETLRVVLDLPQQTAAHVRKHQRAAVITDQGRVSPTNISVFPFADKASKTFQVRLDLPDGQFSLYPGMFVKVAFVIGTAERLLIRSSALVQRSEVTGVYVVGASGEVRLRQVRVGNQIGDRTEVLAGLKVGERLAADPVAAGIYAKSLAAGSE